jgi:hypothetical protein
LAARSGPNFFKENAMFKEERADRFSRPRRASVALVEERTWVGFYRRVGDPSIAAEVVQYLESDAELKRTCPGLYLRAKESVRRQKEREARAKRIGMFVRTLCNAMFVTPVMALRRLIRTSGEVAIECLPDVTAGDVAARRVRALKTKPEFVQARAEFDRTALPGSSAKPSAQDGEAKSREAANAA